jgi:uncharacterized membrane protein
VNRHRPTDYDIERMVAVLLRTGVIVSGLVVTIGGAVFLSRHGGEDANYQKFQTLPAADRLVPKIVAGAIDNRARSIIQVGILLLIATPIARVAFSLLGFAFEGDKKYILITAIVLAILIYGVISGVVRG